MWGGVMRGYVGRVEGYVGRGYEGLCGEGL